MSQFWILLIGLICLATTGTARSPTASGASSPETVEFASGSLRLHGFVFRPSGSGRHPAVLFLHGIGQDYRPEISAVGGVYAGHGYLLFAPYRRGQGLSAGQGEAISERLNREQEAHGIPARMRLQDELLSTEQMDDVLAALAYLRAMPDVDPNRIAVAGNSLGGILAVYVAERAAGIQAVVSSAPAAQTWARSPELRERLLNAARHARVAIFFFQAANDYDLAPTEQLSIEMTRAGKSVIRKIYPAFGQTNADGHGFGYFGGAKWGADVFPFLEMHLASK